MQSTTAERPDEKERAKAPSRPVALSVRPDGIPAELKTLPRWVCWRYTEKPSKNKPGGKDWTKPPFAARTGRKASSTDSATWTTFDEAFGAYQRGTLGFDGIGFVLSAGPDDPLDIAGVDLDKIGNPPEAWAADAARALATYAEWSPSGHGLRIFLLGKLPAEASKKKGRAEAYQTGRYLTMTGHRLPDAPPDITRPDDATLRGVLRSLDLLPVPEQTKRSPSPPNPNDMLDGDLVARMFAARNGPAVRSLWGGDTSAYGDDHSAADLALCNQLAFWTGGDASRMDRLFRNSGLMRPKWDEVHYSDGSTYGATTIRTAVAGCRDGYDPARNGEGRRRPDPERNGPSPEGDGERCRPEIVITSEESVVVSRTIDALAADEELYTRGGILARVQRVEPARLGQMRRTEGMPEIRPLPRPALRERITQFARLIRIVETRDGLQAKSAHPPEWLPPEVEARGCWPGLRPLDGVIECPTIRPDGSILERPGYDPATALLYEPNAVYPDVPPNPTRDDALHAAKRLLELVCDFPFAGVPHKAAWLAAILTLIGRPAIDGCCPMFLFDASTAGSGKSKLVNLASVLATGRDAPVTACPEDDDEMRKLLTSVVLSGNQLLLLDNLDGARRLGGAALDAALTATVWTERLLGKSETTPRMALRTVFMATGNNVGLRGDTHRRVLPCRLEPDCERPEERNDFRFPDLIGHARRNRGGYVRDALTVLRAYVIAGRPKAGLPAWGSYEGWSDTIRQAVYWATTADPCETRAGVRIDDAGSDQLSALLDAWAELPNPGEYRTLKSVFATLERSSGDHPLRMLFSVWSRDGKMPTVQVVGCRLAHFRGRIIHGRRLDRREQRGGKEAAMWALRSTVRGGDSGDCGD